MSTESSRDLDGMFERRDGVFSVLRFSRRLPAAQERVWWAISDPEGARLWLNAVDRLELSEGGAFLIRTYDENDPAAWTSGVVTEVQPPRVLEYTWNQGPYAGGPALQSKVRYELEPEAAGTRLSLSHLLYDHAGEKYVTAFLAAWHHHLDALGKTLAGTYQDFADYVSQLVAESGLYRREFLVKQLGGMRDAYAEKLSETEG
jgi:uncharacterized protein YndB with AHSA1/START domain